MALKTYDEPTKQQDEAAFKAVFEGVQRKESIRKFVGELGGEDPHAVELAQPGLQGFLHMARETYEELGKELEAKGKVVRRERPSYVRARRLLEEVWGVNALRQAPRELDSKSAIVKDPSRAGGTFFPVAVVGFEQYLVPKGRDVVLQLMRPRKTYYGPEGITSALRDEFAVVANALDAAQDEVRYYSNRPQQTLEYERARRKVVGLTRRRDELSSAVEKLQASLTSFDKERKAPR